jgi:large subunit GTPase 1
MTANGQPNQARGARLVLKEYVGGKLLYCYAPPGVEQNIYHKFPERMSLEKKLEMLPPRQQRAMKTAQINKSSSDLDRDFFIRNNLNSHIQGRTNYPHIRMPVTQEGESTSESLSGSMLSLNYGSTMSLNSASSGMMMLGKQKHAKRPKREKLRKTYAHLDLH